MWDVCSRALICPTHAKPMDGLALIGYTFHRRNRRRHALELGSIVSVTPRLPKISLVSAHNFARCICFARTQSQRNPAVSLGGVPATRSR